MRDTNYWREKYNEAMCKLDSLKECSRLKVFTALEEALGTSDPAEALKRVQDLKRRAEKDARSRNDIGSGEANSDND